MPEEKHYVPGSDAEKQAAEEAAKAQAQATADAEAAEKAKAEAEAAEKAKAEQDAKPDAEDEAEAEDEAKDQLQKRSIYHDYKDKKREAKEATARAEAAEKKAAELQALLDRKDDAKTPEAKAEVDDEIAAFAEKQKLDPAALSELASLILKRVPKAEMPEGLSKEEIEQWRASQAAAKREAEDRAILAQSEAVKAQLDIHDAAELAKVMAELVKLAHTKGFHDKEIEYIVWKNKDALSKLVSPKKPSFEQGSGNRAEGSDATPDFTAGGKVTPVQAQEATRRAQRSTYEITNPK